VSYGTYFFLKGVFLFMDVPDLPTFIVLCGKTGSGKSLVLRQLELQGFPVINLEKIASHRGSAFGNLLLSQQPSQPVFDNELAKAFQSYIYFPYIFVEQKSQSIGKRKIPGWFYSKMQSGICVTLCTDKNQRVKNLLGEYKAAGKAGLMNGLHLLKERLAPTVMIECESLLHGENYEAFIEKMLDYYDEGRQYTKSKHGFKIEVESNTPLEMTKKLLEALMKKGIVLPNSVL
jgi:tRNA 2-selenouridine synthase